MRTVLTQDATEVFDNQTIHEVITERKRTRGDASGDASPSSSSSAQPTADGPKAFAHDFRVKLHTTDGPSSDSLCGGVPHPDIRRVFDGSVPNPFMVHAAGRSAFPIPLSGVFPLPIPSMPPHFLHPELIVHNAMSAPPSSSSSFENFSSAAAYPSSVGSLDHSSSASLAAADPLHTTFSASISVPFGRDSSGRMARPIFHPSVVSSSAADSSVAARSDRLSVSSSGGTDPSMTVITATAPTPTSAALDMEARRPSDVMESMEAWGDSRLGVDFPLSRGSSGNSTILFPTSPKTLETVAQLASANPFGRSGSSSGSLPGLSRSSTAEEGVAMTEPAEAASSAEPKRHRRKGYEGMRIQVEEGSVAAPGVQAFHTTAALTSPSRQLGSP